MGRDANEVGELVAKVFDRFEREFPGASIEDAVLCVEISDPNDTVLLDDNSGREVPATIVLLESTSDRLVVQGGILAFANDMIVGGSAA